MLFAQRNGISDRMKYVITVPIFRSELDVFEEVSIRQLHKILGKYDIVFVTPESLEFDFRRFIPEYRVETFDDYFFQSAGTYSELLLTQLFYERFLEYQWMLIYQLDAFVFSDRLDEFASNSYDYIGAPVVGALFEEMGSFVGNGGLSLRKIDRVISVLNSHGDIARKGRLAAKFRNAEDAFYAYCGGRKDIDFNIADLYVAERFSVEFNIDHGIDKAMEGILPFGTHYWYKNDYDKWKKIIEASGEYKLPDPRDCDYFEWYEDGNKWWREYSTLQKIGKTDKKTIEKLVAEYNLDFLKNCVLWGAGRNGRRCIRLLEALGIDQEFVYDADDYALSISVDICTVVRKPNIESLREEERTIVVTMSDIPQSVTNMLSEAELIEGIHWMGYLDFEMKIDTFLKSFDKQNDGGYDD